MSGNRKGWKWCRKGRHWVFDFPLGTGSICDRCWQELINRDKDRAEAKAAAEYLERDYTAECL